MIALVIAVPRAGESKVVDSRDDDVEMFLVSFTVDQKHYINKITTIVSST